MSGKLSETEFSAIALMLEPEPRLKLLEDRKALTAENERLTRDMQSIKSIIFGGPMPDGFELTGIVEEVRQGVIAHDRAKRKAEAEADDEAAARRVAEKELAAAQQQLAEIRGGDGDEELAKVARRVFHNEAVSRGLRSSLACNYELLKPDWQQVYQAVVRAVAAPFRLRIAELERELAQARKFHTNEHNDRVAAETVGNSLAAELAATQQALADAQQALNRIGHGNAWTPDVCPITGRDFFGWIKDENGQYHPTYGDARTCYTIPMLDAANGNALHDRDLVSRKYDHDLGGWTEYEIQDVRLIDDSRLVDLLEAESELNEAKQALADARAEVERLVAEILRIDRMAYPSVQCDAIDRLARQLEANTKPQEPKPRIVCLCGSTRFMEAFQKANLDETLAGRIVLSVGCNTKSDGDLFKGDNADEIKKRLDELHKRKIDIADEVLVLDVGGYVGESTRSEIEHAKSKGKPIRYLSKEQSDAPAQPAASEPADHSGDANKKAEPPREFRCPKCGGTECIVSLGGCDNFGAKFPEKVACGEIMNPGCNWRGTWAEVEAAKVEQTAEVPLGHKLSICMKDREAAEQRADEYVKEIERRIKLEAELRREVANNYEVFRDANYWRWQGDGQDYPESLTCQVVMTAEQLRELLQRAERAEAAVGVMLAALEQCDAVTYAMAIRGVEDWMKSHSPISLDIWPEAHRAIQDALAGDPGHAANELRALRELPAAMRLALRENLPRGIRRLLTVSLEKLDQALSQGEQRGEVR